MTTIWYAIKSIAILAFAQTCGRFTNHRMDWERRLEQGKLTEGKSHSTA